MRASLSRPHPRTEHPCPEVTMHACRRTAVPTTLLRSLATATCLVAATAAHAQTGGGFRPTRWTSRQLATMPPHDPEVWKRGSVAISPDGEEVAYVTDSTGFDDGHRSFVTRGDVPGEAFTDTYPPVFASGRELLAYKANAGGEWTWDIEKGSWVVKGGTWHVVVNGERSEPYTSVGKVRVTPDGRRIYYSAATEAGQRLHFVGPDGTTSTEAYEQLGLPVFTPDGAHWVAAAKREGKYLVLVDGRPRHVGDCTVAGPALSADGRTVAFGEGCGDGFRVVVNGKPGPEYEDTTIPMVSARGRVAYGALRNGAWRLVVDGVPQRREWSDLFLVGYSPDGGHFSFVGKREDERFVVVLDGKEGPPVSAMVPPEFDSRGRLTYATGDAHGDEMRWRVHAGTASATTRLTPDRFVLSPDGRTTAVVGHGESEAEVFVEVGAKRFGPYDWVGPLTFSDDGSRVAFATVEGDAFWLRVFPVR